MEEHYQKHYVEKGIQLETYPKVSYEKELSKEKKRKIFKDIYSSIDMFDKLIGDVVKYHDSI